MNLSALPTHPALIIQAADVVDRLPAAAAADFQALRNDAQNAHAVLSSMTDRLQERRSEKRQAEGQRGQLLKLHRLEIDDPRVLAEDTRKLIALLRRLHRFSRPTTSVQPSGRKSLAW